LPDAHRKKIEHTTAVPSPSGRVALLGIAQRTVQVNYQSNSKQLKLSNMLKSNVKTAGDWLKVKRLEKNLTPGHVAEKMGIATSLVCSWESCTREPDIHQIKLLATIMGFDAENFEMPAVKPMTAPYPSST
jgi:DNA-binding transcriptional regulator YiaG